MRRTLKGLLLVAFGVVVGWFAATGRRHQPVPPPASVRTITVHYPDQNGNAGEPGRAYKQLRVFRIQTETGTFDVDRPASNNWIITTFDDDGSRRSRIEYYAAPDD